LAAGGGAAPFAAGASFDMNTAAQLGHFTRRGSILSGSFSFPWHFGQAMTGMRTPQQ
jgi:hypothetical protein